jgi:hypothetical protein
MEGGKVSVIALGVNPTTWEDVPEVLAPVPVVVA